MPRILGLLANKQLFWLLLVFLLIFLTMVWIPGDATSTTDSYSADEAGKLAFYEVVRSFYPQTQRSTKQLVPRGADQRDTIVILGPAREPNEDEWNELYGFVSRGGSVVYAAARQSEGFNASAFRTSMQSQWTPERELDYALNLDDDDFFTIEQTKTCLGPVVPWHSMGEITTGTSYGTDVLARSGNQVQAVRRLVGNGYIVFTASDYVFRNKSLLHPQSDDFAFKLLEFAYPDKHGRVFVDESLNSSGTPRVLGILFAPLFRQITLQMLIVTVLFGWWGSRRFGPAIVKKTDTRRAIVEHAQALGNMHFKVGGAQHALKSYFEYFRNAAGIQGGRIEKIAGVLAVRSGFDRAHVEALLNDTQRAIQDPQIGTSTAAPLIMRLAELRERMTNYGKR